MKDKRSEYKKYYRLFRTHDRLPSNINWSAFQDAQYSHTLRQKEFTGWRNYWRRMQWREWMEVAK